jgi:hypothetical protein
MGDVPGGRRKQKLTKSRRLDQRRRTKKKKADREINQRAIRSMGQGSGGHKKRALSDNKPFVWCWDRTVNVFRDSADRSTKVKKGQKTRKTNQRRCTPSVLVPLSRPYVFVLRKTKGRPHMPLLSEEGQRGHAVQQVLYNHAHIVGNFIQRRSEDLQSCPAGWIYYSFSCSSLSSSAGAG